MLSRMYVIRRLLSAAGISACFVVGSAASTITQDGTFSTQGQSLWKPGVQTDNFHFDCLTAGCFGLTGLTWGAYNDSVSGISIIPTLPGSWTLSGSLNPGYAGLNLTLDRSGGSADVDYPVKLTYNTPNSAKPGDQVSVGTSYMRQGTPMLQTTGAQDAASVNFVAKVSGDVTDTYHPLIGADQVLFDQTIDTGVINQPILSVGSGNLNASWNIPGFASGVSLNVPNQLNLSTNTFDGAGKLVVGGSANPPILSLDGDLADLVVLGAAAFGVKIPALSGTVGPLSYSFFSAKVQAGPGLREDFSFGVNSLPITLTANTGETHTGKVGDNFFFAAPANGPLVIDTSVDIDNTFNSMEGLSLALGFSWNILSASLGYNNVNFVGIGPLAQGSYPIASTGCLVCWTDTNFALGGFNTLDNQLVIPIDSPTPEPAAFVLTFIGGAGLFGLRRMRRRAV